MNKDLVNGDFSADSLKNQDAQKAAQVLNAQNEDAQDLDDWHENDHPLRSGILMILMIAASFVLVGFMSASDSGTAKSKEVKAAAAVVQESSASADSVSSASADSVSFEKQAE